VQLLLPLTLIVSALAVLNLEHAVFDVMGGVRETTAADSSYAFILALSFVSLVLFPILLVAYLFLAVQRRRASGERVVE